MEWIDNTALICASIAGVVVMGWFVYVFYTEPMPRRKRFARSTNPFGRSDGWLEVIEVEPQENTKITRDIGIIYMGVAFMLIAFGLVYCVVISIG